MNNLIIIPSLNPTAKLIKLIKELNEKELSNIIIINDGSSNDYNVFFDAAKKLNCVVINHSKNKGKGSAIKTALKEYEKYFKHITGFITVDSDGQHCTADILKIHKELERNQDDIILGIRNFKDKSVPWKSKFGNKFSSWFFKFSTSRKLSDTQTGLRGIPLKYKELMLNTDGNRFEYEMNFLLAAADYNINFNLIPIKTIYNNKNKESHFNPVQDSMRIYKSPLLYIFSSISSTLIDLTLFTILSNYTSLIIISYVIARVVSGIYNFELNKMCFQSKGNRRKQFSKFVMLFIFTMIISSSLVKILSITKLNITLIKIMVDTPFFIVNYIIQKKYIFKRTK